MCRTLHLYVQTKTLKNGQNVEIYKGLHYDIKTVEKYLVFQMLPLAIMNTEY